MVKKRETVEHRPGQGGAPYYYRQGYADYKAGKPVRRVPQNFKLAYLNGRGDARAGTAPRHK